MDRSASGATGTDDALNRCTIQSGKVRRLPRASFAAANGAPPVAYGLLARIDDGYQPDRNQGRAGGPPGRRVACVDSCSPSRGVEKVYNCVRQSSAAYS